MNDRIKLVTFGRNGDTAYCARDQWGKSTITGYGSPDRPHAGEGKGIADGTPALNLRPALETAEGISWVFKGPMVDVDLAEDAIEKCPEPSALLAGALAGNQYGTLLAIHQTTKKERAGSLDYVSMSEYIREWVSRGAVLGYYQNDRIVWP